MLSDETTPNLLAAPKAEITSEGLELQRLPQRLGRESTRLILPTSNRVKRMRRGKKRKLVLVVCIALGVLIVLFFGSVFAFRERIQQRLFPTRAPVMIDASPKAKPVPKAAPAPTVP